MPLANTNAHSNDSISCFVKLSLRVVFLGFSAAPFWWFANPLFHSREKILFLLRLTERNVADADAWASQLLARISCCTRRWLRGLQLDFSHIITRGAYFLFTWCFNLNGPNSFIERLNFFKNLPFSNCSLLLSSALADDNKQRWSPTRRRTSLQTVSSTRGGSPKTPVNRERERERKRGEARYRRLLLNKS